MGTFVFPRSRPGFTDRYPQKPGQSFLPSPQQIIGPAAAAMMPQGKPLSAATRNPLALRDMVKVVQYNQPGGERFSQNPDVVHSYNQPFTAQRDYHYGRSQSSAKMANYPVPPGPPAPQPMPASTGGRVTPAAPGGMPAMPSVAGPAPSVGGQAGTRTATSFAQPDAFAASLGRSPSGSPGIAQSSPPSLLTGQFNTPYYRDRVARQAAGQGSPFRGMAPTVGLAARARPAPQQQTQFVSTDGGQQPSQNPLTEPMGNPIAGMRRSTGQGLQSLTNPTEFAKYAAAGGTKPLMVYSGSGREGPLNKLAMARNREEMNARQNRLGEGGMTFDQAVADRANFNKDGRFFQGAKLSEQNGRPVFVSDEKPTFAGGAANEADAAGGRIAALMRMQKQGKGYVTPDNKFVGMAGAGGGDAGAANASLLRDVPDALAKRIPQGVEIGSSPANEQMAANKAGMLARLQARKDKAGQIRTERAQAIELARRNAPSPQMQAMLAQNPELAIRFMEAQQRGQLAQQGLGLQQQQLGIEGRKVDQAGQLARDQIAAQDRRDAADRDFRRAEGDAGRRHAVDLQRPLIDNEKTKLASADKNAEADRNIRQQLAGQQAAIEREKIAAEQGTKQTGTTAALAAKAMEGMTPEQQQEFLANWQQQQAGAGPAAITGVGGALPPADITNLGKGRTFAGGTLTKTQFLEAQKVEDPTELVSLLRSYNLPDDQVTVALNELKPPNFLANVSQGPFGLMRLMQGKTWAPRHRSADDPSAFGNMARDRFIDPKTGKTKTTFFGRALGVKED